MAKQRSRKVEIEYARPQLYPKQRAAFFCPARYSLVEASTKSGKTVGCMAWLIEQALQGGPGKHYWWVAPVYIQSKIAFRRMRDGLPSEIYLANESELTLRLINGATIWCRSGEKPDHLYGEDVYAAVIDEASRLREEAWHAVRSTLTATRGPVRIVGNVKGRRNWFWRLCRRAEAGEPDMEYHRITADDAVSAGVIERDEIESARRDLPEHVFRELYYAEASDDAGNPFGLDAIRQCVGPLSSDPPAYWGWDLAKSVDWTVGIGLDEHGRVARLVRFQQPWQETIQSILAEAGSAPALVDSTGVGDPIVEALQREGGPNFEGYRFSTESKQRLMEGLAVAIQRREVSYPDGPIVAELEQFEYAYSRTGVRYSAPEGMHDDCVCALALAVELRRQRGGARWEAIEWTAADQEDDDGFWTPGEVTYA